jgi:hypothetical protein
MIETCLGSSDTVGESNRSRAKGCFVQHLFARCRETYSTDARNLSG